MNPTARPSHAKAPRSGVALLLGTYSLSAVFVSFLASNFDYEHAIVYRHLILIATVVLSVFSLLLIVPRGVIPDALGIRALAAGVLTIIPAILAILYAACYVSNVSWGENITLSVVLAHARGIQFHWVNVFPFPHAVPTLVAAALLLALLSARSYAAYRRLSSYLVSAAAEFPRAKLAVPALTFGLLLALAWEAHSNPWMWVGEPVTNFFGWPPASSLMGLQSQATQDDLAEARHYAPATQGDRRNVIVIIVDSLRAGHMSLYGYPRDTTPFLRSLGEAGKLHKVRLALSTCSESYCGIATIMASRHFHQVSPHSFKLFDLLARHGYRKRFFLTGDHVGWAVLKDFYAVDPSEVYDAQGSAGRDLLDDRRVLDGLRTLAPYDGGPHFIYCFLMSSHIIGTRQAGFERWRPASSAGLRELWTAPRGSVAPRVPTAEIVNFYDNGILQADGVIREIFEILGDRGYLRDSVVVITGDHGEGLGEHGHFGHSRYLYQEDIHVPLLFYDPDPGRYQNDFFATHVDIAPTIVERLGLPLPTTWVGRSLLQPGLKDYSLHQAGRGRSLCRAIVKPMSDKLWKYMRCGSEAAGVSEEVYDLVNDPGERENQAARVDENLMRLLRNQLARVAQ